MGLFIVFLQLDSGRLTHVRNHAEVPLSLSDPLLVALLVGICFEVQVARRQERATVCHQELILPQTEHCQSYT